MAQAIGDSAPVAPGRKYDSKLSPSSSLSIFFCMNVFCTNSSASFFDADSRWILNFSAEILNFL